MVAPGAPCSSLRLVGETIIRARDADSKLHDQVLPISNFDRLMGGLPVIVFYVYNKPSTGDHASIVAAIKASVTVALVHSPPFAGQIVHNPESGEAEILCNNRGAKLIEASACVSLATLDFHDLNESVHKFMIPITDEFPLSVQVTGYDCGGFSVAWRFDHLLTDASGFIKFLSLLSEIAKTSQISAGGLLLDHDRSIFPSRTPPIYGPLLDKIYTVFTLDEIKNMPPNDITLKRLYYVDGSIVDRLQAEASRGSTLSLTKRTRIQSLSAHLLKLMAGTVDRSDVTVTMGLVVDGRAKLGAPADYIGNVVSVAMVEASARELKNGSLADVADVVSRAVGEVANWEHFVELNDWVECHRPGPMAAELLFGRGDGPVVVVSSCHTMSVMPAGDFGLGRPTLGFFYSPAEQLEMGYVNIVTLDGGGDGRSWFVSMHIWPRLAVALESDPCRVFQPVASDHLRSN